MKSANPCIRARLLVTAFLIVSAALSGCASTTSSKGICSYPDEEITNITQQAESGDAGMQYILANIYYSGTCLKRDFSLSRELMKKAAEQGNAQAQYILGVRLSVDFYGGFEKDPEQALFWITKSAELGNADAQRRLGNAYSNGGLALGVEKDPIQAAFWYRKAAKQGDKTAQNRLGRYYYSGIGVEKDLEQARFWYQKAAEQGHYSAKIALKKLDCELDPVGCKQRAEAQKRKKAEEQKIVERNAAEKKRNAAEKKQAEFVRVKESAENGDAEAQYKLGTYYLSGSTQTINNLIQTTGASSDSTSPRNGGPIIGIWGGKFGTNGIRLEITEHENNSYSGRILKSNRIGGVDCTNAEINLEKQSSGYGYYVRIWGFAWCKYKGELSVSGQRMHGKVVPVGGVKETAINLFKLDRYFSMAQLQPADEGFVEQDLAEAARWFRKSADQGHAQAQFALGIMYQEGVGGISKDIVEATVLYQKAADQEHQLARVQLCSLDSDCIPSISNNNEDAAGVGALILCLYTPILQYLCAAALMGGGV